MEMELVRLRALLVESIAKSYRTGYGCTVEYVLRVST